jgi:hypothetical protein
VLDIRGAEATLEENIAPAASIEGGTVLATGPQSGIKTLAYSATDRESGIARVSAMAGRTVVGTTDFAADCAFAALLACAGTRNGTIDVDTRKVADGLYPVSLRVTDAAGNEQVVQSSTAIQVVSPHQSRGVRAMRATRAFRHPSRPIIEPRLPWGTDDE